MPHTRWKLLIIDDDAMMRDMFARAFQTFGFNPILAPDGPSGLKALDNNPDVAVLILDWMMPGASGLEILKDIKARPNPPPVLMLSAKNRKEDVLEAIQAGVQDYITKPVHLGQLVLRLNNLIERNRDRLAHTPEQAPRLDLNGHTAFTIIDISESGVQLESTFPTKRDSILFLESPEIADRLRLPREYGFPVRVATCAPHGKRYHIGAHFVGVDPEVAERLKEACQSPTAFRANR